MNKRMDSLSRPSKAFVFGNIDGITVKPKLPKITASHFTPTRLDGIVEAKVVRLTKAYDYYGAPRLDPVGV